MNNRDMTNAGHRHQARWLKHLPTLLIVLVVALAIGLGMYFKSQFADDPAEQKKMVQQITIIAAPPPPPPPPPPKLEEPEPEEAPIEEELEEALPDQNSEEPAGEDLGVDADGGAGSDGFGLVAKKGGRGLLGGGGYIASIKAEINKALLRDKTLRTRRYEAIVTLWLEDDGSFSRYEVDLVDGDDSTASELTRFFTELGGIGKPRPLEEKANRFRFRITSVI